MNKENKFSSFKFYSESFDPLGSYTGFYSLNYEYEPEQDADDL